MRTVTCPGCGQSGKISDDDAGVQAKCPKCSTIMAVSAAVESASGEMFELGIEIGEAETPPALPMPPRRRIVSTDSPSSPDQVASGLPWYYKFLEFLAYFGIFIGVVGGTIGVFIGLGESNHSTGARSAASLQAAIYSGAFTVSSLILPALILLALDACKTLRAVRDRLEADAKHGGHTL
ncbi:hypothetical protein EP7_000108 [Isosphaeraceae bacterium EP7]